jgi:ubiquinone/menaquinone biosynthesis C-methylase UbiE
MGHREQLRTVFVNAFNKWFETVESAMDRFLPGVLPWSCSLRSDFLGNRPGIENFGRNHPDQRSPLNRTRIFRRLRDAGHYIAISLLCCIVFAGSALAQQATDGGSARDASTSQIPPGRSSYMGRKIAETMHFSGAEWLIRDEREREERCSMMLANLGIQPGMVVCDMGCGNGFYSLLLAQRIGKQGQVLAVDIQPQMLYLLRDRAEQVGVNNITPILGSIHDPRLPRASVDLVLMVDVYHELSHPELVLAATKRALKKNGLMVLVEYRAEDPTVPIRPLHKMSRQQIMREMNANGFQLKREFKELPWQHMMFFGVAEEESTPQDRDSAE